MLSEEDVGFFRRRIDELMEDARLSEWQRQFLGDMRGKIARYGVRTKVSDKQFAILKRLTQEKSTRPNLRLISAAEPLLPSPPPAKQVRQHGPLAFSSRRDGGPFRMPRNPLRPRNPFRVRNPFRPRTTYQHLRRASRFSWAILIGVMLVITIVSSLSGLVDQGAENSAGQSAAIGTAVQRSDTAVDFTVTDGDTIRLNDGTRVRLVGFNTPEKFEPMCSNEAKLGNRASDRLRELVGQANSTNVSLVACSCKPGTEGTKKCNYGRKCGKLDVDGRDVGQILISEGLAVPFVCGATGCPRTPRPWCG